MQMSLSDDLKKELAIIAQRDRKSNKESAQLKKYALKLQGTTTKNIQFKDKDFLNKYYRDQDDSLDLLDFNSNRIPTLDELTEEEQMNRLEDRKKKSTKPKPKRKITKKCKCK
jgi:hypothetical protein